MKNEFSDIKNLVEKTLNKYMTFLVTYENRLCVVKKIKRKENAIDNVIVNELKPIFGLNKLSNMKYFESLYDISPRTNKVFKNKNNIKKIFLITDYIENSSMISDNINILENSDILFEYIKCALYRGIWRVTDFWAGNILISSNKLYSIDENDIGKQKNIIKKRDINKYINEGITINIIEKLTNDLLNNYQDNEEKIKNILIEFDRFNYIELIENNLKNLKKDICIDLNILQ